MICEEPLKSQQVRDWLFNAAMTPGGTKTCYEEFCADYEANVATNDEKNAEEREAVAQLETLNYLLRLATDNADRHQLRRTMDELGERVRALRLAPKESVPLITPEMNRKILNCVSNRLYELLGWHVDSSGVAMQDGSVVHVVNPQTTDALIGTYRIDPAGVGSVELEGDRLRGVDHWETHLLSHNASDKELIQKIGGDLRDAKVRQELPHRLRHIGAIVQEQVERAEEPPSQMEEVEETEVAAPPTTRRRNTNATSKARGKRLRGRNPFRLAERKFI